MAELLHPAFEQYCEAIFELREDDLDVIQARIAERLGVSRPAVSEMIRRMTTEGLVRTTKGTIGLTDPGVRLAEQVVRRHRLAERFLTDILGLSWAEAHHEAGKWEHVLSEPVEAAINRLLDNPTTCPHGNPIPGSRYEAPDAVALLRSRRRRRVHREPHPRGARVHARAARVPRGQRDHARPRRAWSRRRHPTAPSPCASATRVVGVGAFAQPAHPRRRPADRQPTASSGEHDRDPHRERGRRRWRARAAVAASECVRQCTTNVLSPSTSHHQIAAPDHGARRRAARVGAHRAMSSTATGSTTTTWRPGHQKPCMVSATNVAVSQPASEHEQRAATRRRSAAPSGGNDEQPRRLPRDEAVVAVDEQREQAATATERSRGRCRRR